MRESLETLVSEWMLKNDPRGMSHGRLVQLLRSAPLGEPRDPETVAILCAAEVARQAQREAEATASGDNVLFAATLGNRSVVKGGG